MAFTDIFSSMAKPAQPSMEELLGGTIPQNEAPAVNIMDPAERIDERRPCYAHGRKALFHRWAISAHPVLPRGVEPGDKDARWYQYRNLTGLVEYEDGTMGRVYPSNLQFADGGGFENFTWRPQITEESKDNE